MSATPPRPVLVTTGAATPPGQLTWPAWEALRSRPVLAAEGHPHLAPLAEAGVQVQAVPGAELAARLRDRAAAGEPVAGLPLPGDAALVAELGADADVVVGGQDPPGARLLDVVAVMDRLRSPGGCPWDAQQTSDSLRRYLLEEAYEAYAAIEDGDAAALREELGDVLLQVVFHARLAQEADPPWSVDDVAGDLVAKLVRRHPHVFAGGPADDLEASWDAVKAAEKGRTSVTEGVPLGQPALQLAAKLQGRGDRLGAPLPSYDGPGGQLWELVRACRERGVDPEEALRAVARAHRDQLAAAERVLRAAGEDPARTTPARWAQVWPGAGRSTSPPP